MVIDKENAHARTGIFMVDASRGFRKDGNKNRLRAQDIHRIVDVFNHQSDVPRYSRMVPVAEIADPANDYNLNIPRYVDASEPEDLHDLDAHLNGGIPDRDLDGLGRLVGRVSVAARYAVRERRPRRLQPPAHRQVGPRRRRPRPRRLRRLPTADHGGFRTLV